MPRQQDVLAEWGPFFGMRYSFDPSDNGENRSFVYEALNMVPIDALRGGAYLRRVGDARATVAASALVCQWLGVYRKRSGFVNVGIFAGEIYTRAGVTWTKRITTANLTAAGITLSATATCGCLTYTDELVVNDSVNQPFMWNGTAGGGLTLLSNAPTKCYGVPTVYYGKLFFVKWVAASDQSTIVWSEENAANLGYEAGGYTNSWTLEQSGSGSIYAIAGTNDGLYFLRERGIGVIRGAVTSTFSSDGVHDSVSTYEGTLIPWGVTIVGEEVYFPLTQTGELSVITGGRVLRLGADIQDALLHGPVNTSSLIASEARTAWVPFYDAIAIAYGNSSVDIQDPAGVPHPAIFLYSMSTKRCIARFTFQFDPLEAAIAGPVIGSSYESNSHAFGLTICAQNAGSTYTFHTPQELQTVYDPANPPSLFRLTLAPYVAPANTVAAAQQVEALFDVLPKNSGSATTLTIAERTSDNYLNYVAAGLSTDLGSVTLSQLAAAARQEKRAVVQFNDRRRNLQLSVRDSGTLRNYGWGLKRLAVKGVLEPLDQVAT